MRLHVLDDLGAVRLSDLHRRDVQDFADRMIAAGHDASTIRNTLCPLQVLYRASCCSAAAAASSTAAGAHRGDQPA